MIIRILSVQVEPDRGADFHEFIRERGLPRIQRHPGLISAHVGRRTEGHDELAIVVTVWKDWDSLTDALGPDPSEPYLLTPSTGLVVSSRVEHFEAIDLPSTPQPEPDPDAPVMLATPSASA